MILNWSSTYTAVAGQPDQFVATWSGTSISGGFYARLPTTMTITTNLIQTLTGPSGLPTTMDEC